LGEVTAETMPYCWPSSSGNEAAADKLEDLREDFRLRKIATTTTAPKVTAEPPAANPITSHGGPISEPCSDTAAELANAVVREARFVVEADSVVKTGAVVEIAVETTDDVVAASDAPVVISPVVGLGIPVVEEIPVVVGVPVDVTGVSSHVRFRVIQPTCNDAEFVTVPWKCTARPSSRSEECAAIVPGPLHAEPALG
jgi:hypothetical protein